MTSNDLIDEKAVEAVADAIQEAMAEAQDAYGYRRKIDKSGYEVMFSTPDQYEFCGEGTIIANRKHLEAARQFTERKQALFIAKAAIAAMKGIKP